MRFDGPERSRGSPICPPAAMRTGVKLTLVANQPVRLPVSPLIEFVQASPGFDVADNEIVKRAGCGDLVITANIPLAVEVMGNSVHALSPRGELCSTETIGQRLNMSDFLDTLHTSEIHTGRPSAKSQYVTVDDAPPRNGAWWAASAHKPGRGPTCAGVDAPGA